MKKINILFIIALGIWFTTHTSDIPLVVGAPQSKKTQKRHRQNQKKQNAALLTLVTEYPDEIITLNQKYITQLQQILREKCLLVYSAFSLGEEIGETIVQLARTHEDTPNHIAQALLAIKEHDAKHPLWSVTEVTDVDMFSRIKNPLARQTYEADVVGHLLALANTPNPINYVSVESEDLLQDLVILAKTLLEKPDVQINMHCIDNADASFFDYCAQEQIPACVTYGQPINYERIMAKAALDIDFLPNYIPTLASASKFNNLHKFIATHFPAANITLHAYRDVADYLSKNQHADIIVAADPRDTATLKSLHLQCLKHNPSVYFTGLIKSKDQKPIVMHVHADENEKLQSYSIPLN